MTIGLGLLRLAPRDFWQMTPREFEAACRGLFGEPAGATDRAALADLMRQYPDGKGR